MEQQQQQGNTDNLCKYCRVYPSIPQHTIAFNLNLMPYTPTKKRKRKTLLLLPNKGTDNPSSPFAAACTINVKRTPVSENSPSLQLQFQKHRQPNKNHVWCKFQFVESYRTSSPPTSSTIQQTSRIVVCFYSSLSVLDVCVLQCGVGGLGGRVEGGSLNVSFSNHGFCMFWYIRNQRTFGSGYLKQNQNQRTASSVFFKNPQRIHHWVS